MYNTHTLKQIKKVIMIILPYDPFVLQDDQQTRQVRGS